jgi:hypothetical protein
MWPTTFDYDNKQHKNCSGQEDGRCRRLCRLRRMSAAARLLGPEYGMDIRLLCSLGVVQAAVSATSWSLVQGSPSGCVRKPQKWGGVPPRRAVEEQKKNRKPQKWQALPAVNATFSYPYIRFSFVINAGGVASVNINCGYRIHRITSKCCQQLLAKRPHVSRNDHRLHAYFITCRYRTPLPCRLLLIPLFHRCFYKSSLLLCRLTLLTNVISFPLEFNFYIIPS